MDGPRLVFSSIALMPDLAPSYQACPPEATEGLGCLVAMASCLVVHTGRQEERSFLMSFCQHPFPKKRAIACRS